VEFEAKELIHDHDNHVWRYWLMWELTTTSLMFYAHFLEDSIWTQMQTAPATRQLSFHGNRFAVNQAVLLNSTFFHYTFCLFTLHYVLIFHSKCVSQC